MKPFDILHTPLDGNNLIEASAGTGKTHAIADLFLRLVLEKGYGIDDILVVTFTEAATEELRDRIRNRLKRALNALTGEQAPEGSDTLLVHLVAEHRGNLQMSDRLRKALQNFDEAAIFTIHGFCQRMLRDKPFESNSLFDTELITDQSDLLQEAVDDFWRIYFYTAPALFIQYAIQEKYSPELFLKLIRRRSIDPGLAVIPVLERPDIDHLQDALQRAFDHMRISWQAARPDVAAILCTSPALKRNIYRVDSMESLLREMDTYLGADLVFPLSGRFRLFTASQVSKAVKSGCTIPRHGFFDECETFAALHREVCAVFEQHLLFLKRELFDYADRELKKKKHEHNVRSFDDLLDDMHGALRREDGALARSIRKKFRAALIDEFQDTDPVQYDIFKTVFSPDNLSLFMIGDPKQAIYSFRGADIYTYMKASSAAPDGFTLTTNWRSGAGLIKAINTLFSRARNPFVFEQIQFKQIELADKEKQETLVLPGPAEAPLQIWFIDRQYADKEDGTINKGSAETLVARTVAAEIVRLAVLGQKGTALLRDRALCPGDIAVLVRTNRQARMVQEELELLSMPGVLYGAESIFVSHEAEEVARVVAAVAEPGNERKIRAALATDMFGLSGNDLYCLADSETAWEKRLAAFHDYHEQWAQHGFIRMFRQLIRQEGMRTRLLSYRDGERRMTNLLHCAEVLHRAEIENSLGMDGLIKWFAAKRADDNSSEEDQIRLETDENAVKIITIHRSKGLEYPIVFCPFAWDSAAVKEGPFSFHDPDRDYSLTLDLGSGMAENRIQAARENLAENVRLLYVALTRAKSRCYLVWGKINSAETAAPAYLFHQPGTFPAEHIVTELGKRVSQLGYDEMLSEVESLQKTDGTIRVSGLPVLPGKPYAPQDASSDALVFRRFTGTVEQGWKITSYSTLISAKSYPSDRPDHDRGDGPGLLPPAASGREDIFNFPRGARAGSCIHELLEQIDFSLADVGQARQLIAEKLVRYGLDMRWQNTLWEMVQQLLHMPLEHDRPDVILKNTTPQERLHELEFYFPLERITAAGLAGLFADAGMPQLSDDFIQRMQALGFSPVQGFIRGFVDLVFHYGGKYYIIDWKSNYLGDCPADYGRDALHKAMLEHYYILQYHIYTVALHQYLAMRDAAYDYDRYFGGVYYMFVRGISREYGPEYGIYRDKPSKNLVTALGTYLTGERGTGLHE